MTQSNEPSVSQNKEFSRYILLFVYACIIYSLIGFSWGAIMGGVPVFRHFVDYSAHGSLIVLAHAHINLLGWVEMAIFAALYYVVPTVSRRPIYSLRLVKVHFWMHNFGLIGMVVFFFSAGLVGGLSSGPDTEKLVSHLLAFVGLFGTVVLSANFIWGYNLYKTTVGWQKQV
ncbi:MAG TPA: cbb3-type cytochrome c oxidase subunit I [Gallionella sp.]|nr:cbb3-type cytochrome c oxidase subunit I [Gallionella sp.]